MLTCPKCNITIRGDKRCCPLCQGRLKGEPEDGAFPVLEKVPVSTVTLFRIALFGAVLAEIVFVLISFFNGEWIHSFGVATMAIVFGLIDLAVALYYRGNVLKLITVQAYVILVAVFIIDRHFGAHYWSLAYVIPSVLVALVIVTLLVGRIEGLMLGDYIMYLIVDVIFGLLQVIPIYKGLNPYPFVAAISIAFMVAMAAFVCIFHFRELKNASAKYLNM